MSPTLTNRNRSRLSPMPLMPLILISHSVSSYPYFLRLYSEFLTCIRNPVSVAVILALLIVLYHDEKLIGKSDL